MGSASEDLLVTLQILPGFFSNCLFLALYDSVVLVKRAVTRSSRTRPARRGEWRRMLTAEGLRAIWNGFLLDAHKQVRLRTRTLTAAPSGARHDALVSRSGTKIRTNIKKGPFWFCSLLKDPPNQSFLFFSIKTPPVS